jgi:hypothetical protein
MARGWESKSVEAQMEEFIAEPSRNQIPSSAEDKQARDRKMGLMLSRKYVLHQLESSSDQRYSDLLRRTLAELDAQIAILP